MGKIKDIRKNTIILLIITFIVLFFILEDDIDSIVEAIKIMDYKYVLLAIILFFVSVYLKAFVNYITVNDRKKITKKEAFKHQIIVQFFNGITPFQTGGQPSEVYMLTEHDISLAKSTSITIQCFIFYQISLVLFGLLAIGYNAVFHIFPKVRFLQILVVIGFIINSLVALCLIFITYSKKTTTYITNRVIKLLKKLKIVKNEEAEEKISKRIDEFHEGAKEIRHRKGLLAKGVTINLISFLFLYSIPLFLMYALRDTTSMNLADTLTSSAYVMIIGAFVPVPGASGGIEYSFYKFYGNFLNKRIISTILIVWRFITYYLGMILGGLIFNLEKKVEK